MLDPGELAKCAISDKTPGRLYLAKLTPLPPIRLPPNQKPSKRLQRQQQLLRMVKEGVHHLSLILHELAKHAISFVSSYQLAKLAIFEGTPIRLILSGELAKHAISKFVSF